jgi:predicted CXXCH cytochrome family protein
MRADHHDHACRRNTRRLWYAAAFSLAAAAVWGGCSVEKNYDLLSFFFDGVPDPNAPLTDWTVKGGLPASYMAHKPFEEGRCTECHPKLFVPVQNGSQVCMKCHEGKDREKARMHGPVAANACLFCHSPHDSVYPALLRRAPQQLCRQCHDQFLLDTGRVAAHADDARNCLDCHNGHGGSNAYFLHDSVLEEQSQEVDPPADADPEVDG